MLLDLPPMVRFAAFSKTLTASAVSVVSMEPPLIVTGPLTVKVPAIAVLPVKSATVNLLLSHLIPPLAFNSPVNVVVPVTAKVPAIAVLPVKSATINLLSSHLIPPLAFNAPVNVVVPVTAKVSVFTLVAIKFAESVPSEKASRLD